MAKGPRWPRVQAMPPRLRRPVLLSCYGDLAGAVQQKGNMDVLAVGAQGCVGGGYMGGGCTGVHWRWVHRVVLAVVIWAVGAQGYIGGGCIGVGTSTWVQGLRSSRRPPASNVAQWHHVHHRFPVEALAPRAPLLPSP